MVGVAAVAVLATGVTVAAPGAASASVPGPPQPGAPWVRGCRMFPDNHVLNTRVDRAPVHARSSTMLTRFAQVNPTSLHPGAGALVWQGSRVGIPLNYDGVGRVLALDGSYGSPLTSFWATVPARPRVEGEPGAAWDRHVLVLNTRTCTLDEHINYRYDFWRSLFSGGWSPFVVSGSARWDLSSNARAVPTVAGAPPAEAAGLPMANLIYRYDEVAAGEIRHPIRFVGPNIGSGWTWPATASDGLDRHADALPMGSRLRLRAGADTSRLGPQAKVIATAMQRYGIIASDTAPFWALTGEGDHRWNDAGLATLGRLRPSDFEVVDTSSWRVSPAAFEARVPR